MRVLPVLNDVLKNVQDPERVCITPIQIGSSVRPILRVEDLRRTGPLRFGGCVPRRFLIPIWEGGRGRDSSERSVSVAFLLPCHRRLRTLGLPLQPIRTKRLICPLHREHTVCSGGESPSARPRQYPVASFVLSHETLSSPLHLLYRLYCLLVHQTHLN